jgi:hypothetical protein
MTRSADHYFAIIPENILYADISHIAVRVYGVLRRHADKDNGTCHPGRSRIAKVAHTSPSSVDRAISELVRIGAIEVIHRVDPENPKRLLSNQYRLLTPPAHDDTPPVGDDTPLPLVTIPPPASDEVTIVKEPKSKTTLSPSSDDEQKFDEWWAIYPRKTAKQDARKAWKTATKQTPPADIIAATRHQTTTPGSPLNREPQYVPYPASWLRAGQHLDTTTQPTRETRPYDQPANTCTTCDGTRYTSHQDQQDRWYSTPCPDCQ